MDTVIFFHMNQLGDCIFSLPLLSAARKEWRDKRLVSVARPSLAPLLQASGLVDEVIQRRAGAAGTWTLLRALRRARASKAVLFSESPETLMLAAAGGIPERVGFETASLGFFLTRRAGRSGVPSLANNLKLAAAAGLSGLPGDYANLVTVPESEMARISLWLAANRAQEKNIAVISPGASRRRSEKRWAHGRWAVIMDKITGAGYIPVIVGAPAEQRALDDLALLSKKGARVFAGQAGIVSLAALFRHAKVFAGIDSGALHLAAAVGLPVIGLYGPTDPGQIGPRPAEKHTVIKKDTMDDINVDEVWEALERRLS